jgi:uncharacterized protein YndB with AHSA1/START domain
VAASPSNAEDTLTMTRTVAAPALDVFAVWTQPSLIRRWAADARSIDPRVGARRRDETRSANGLHIVTGEYHEFVRGRRLVIGWIHEGPPGAMVTADTLVTVELRESGPNTTEMRVTETPIAVEDRDAAEAAWTAALDALDRLLAEIAAAALGRGAQPEQKTA